MKDRKFGTMVLAGFGMLVLILDGKTALLGMRDGLEICLWTVIPALFPFLFLSAILTDSLYGKKIPAMGSGFFFQFFGRSVWSDGTGEHNFFNAMIFCKSTYILSTFDICFKITIYIQFITVKFNFWSI